jgi:hypothetical protein
MKTVQVRVEIDYYAQFLQLVYRQLVAELGRMLNRTVLIWNRRLLDTGDDFPPMKTAERKYSRISIRPHSG